MNMFDFWLNRRFIGGKSEKDYIEFVDPVVAQICADTWGDGIGITYAQAAAVTTLGAVFRANTNIVSFDELQYFTSISTITGGNANSGSAFYGCTNLVSVTLPSSCTAIGNYAFTNCTSLERCDGGNVTAFGNYCFQGCSALVDIDLSHAVTVGSTAFRNASLSGMTLYMPNLTSIGTYAFMDTAIASITSLGTITSIPGGNTTQGTGVFASCTSLTSVVLPSTLTLVGGCAFRDCTSLASVNIPSSVTTLEAHAFRFCPLSVTGGTLTITQSITLAAAVFLDSRFTKIVFSDNVAGTTGSLNGSLSTFYSPTLLELDFSANQTSEIGAYLVKNPSGYESCPITTITVRTTTPPSINRYAFNGMDSLSHIYVPASAVDTYKAASVWSGKASIIEAIPA